MGFVLGGILFTWWAKKVWGKINRLLYQEEGKSDVINVQRFALIGLFYLTPGLILFILCCVPSFYIASLWKKERYCLQVIGTDKGIQKDDPFIIEQCKGLNKDELFEKAKAQEDH